MSFSLAWFAVQGVAPDDFLERAGFADTGEPDEFCEAEHSGGDLSGGWYVVVTEAVDLLDMAKLPDWSAGGRLVAAVVLEDSNTSLAMEWRDGRQAWSVFYDGGAETPQLEVEGDLPPAFEAMRAAILAEPAGEDGDDLAFDAALDLAESVTGFRHDALGFDPEAAPFTVLERE